MSQKKKLSRRWLAPVITVSVIFVFLSAILITNIFIPLKYLSAYVNFYADKPVNGELRISFINVGDGDCTFIELPDGKTVLFDGGNGSYKNQLNIFKKLNSTGTDKIDYLFCTSSSSKRCGGLAEIVKYKNIGKIFAPLYENNATSDEYGKFIKEASRKNIPISRLTYGAGEHNEEYGYCFYVLSAEEALPYSVQDDESFSAAWISYGGVNILLFGDMKNSELGNFYERYTASGFDIDGHSIKLEECNIVKVANGGNKTSNNVLLYDLIKAETAIISTAKEPALALLSDVGIYADSNIYRTDKNGTVTLNISGGTYNVKKER